jgi:flagellar motor protein MotB
VAHPDHSPRVGRSQGLSIFWGLVSVFFAAAACFYFWKNHENEINATKMRDEVLTLQDERDTLNSEKEKLQAGMSETATELKTREEFLQAKENKLAEEETRLEGLAEQVQNQSPNQAQQPPPLVPSSVIKKFTGTIRKLSRDDDFHVVMRGGHPVLRISSSVLFATADETLKPDGKALLNQIAQVLGGQMDNYELRVESFTDSDAEIQPMTTKSGASSRSDHENCWELTAARAAAIARFYRDQTTLPFQNVLVVVRGDSEPIASGAREDRWRNRRIEISLTPFPAASRPADMARATSGVISDTATNALAPPPDPPAPVNQAK